MVCKTCDEVHKNCDFNTYRENLAHAINYFINGVDYKNSTYINALSNPDNSGLFNSSVNIIPNFKSNGFNVLSTGPFCIHS